MIWLAFCNLFQNKVRLVISAGGVALALLLILALDAIFTGVEQRITAYIDYSGADIWVSQSDVFNMHMASSSLPGAVARKVVSVPGVAAVSPILYFTNNVTVGAERNLAYIIGLPKKAELGIPWDVSSGLHLPGKGETVMDSSVAEKSGIALGDNVEILGEEFEVVGLSEGTASLVNSVAFISQKDFETMRGSYDTISFLLVKVLEGEVTGDSGRAYKGAGQRRNRSNARPIRPAGASGSQGYEHGPDYHHEFDWLFDRVSRDGIDRVHIHARAPPGIRHAESAWRARTSIFI